MYQARVDAIEGGLRRAEERQAEANALFEQYRAQLADLRSEAARSGRRRRPRARPSARSCSPKAGRSPTASSPPAGSRCRPSGRPSSESFEARWARSRWSWPAGSSASRWRTRPAAGHCRPVPRRPRRRAQWGQVLVGAESRESYAPAIAELNELASNGRPLHGVADELLGVGAVLAGEPRLRRALADPSRTGDERAGLIGSVVEGKVSADTADLLRTLAVAGGRRATSWSTRSSGSASRPCSPAPRSAASWPRSRTSCSGSARSSTGTCELAAALGRPSAPADAAGRSSPHRCCRARLGRRPCAWSRVAVRGFGGRSFAGSLTRLVELAARRRER